MAVGQDLAALLADITHPGTFALEGSVPLVLPVLEVAGVGRIALPVLPGQAKALAAIATPAPYGKGEATIHDPDVRRCLQIDAGEVSIGGPRWEKAFADLLTRVAEGLGVEEPVEAELYKMLVYEEGGFFLDHRDTEKAPGMFATLVVALPSAFEGGALTVRHLGEARRFALRPEEPSDLGFAAFYADCVHAVEPVTQGQRIILTYNLLRRGRRKTRPAPPDHRTVQARITGLLAQWRDTPGGAPDKLVHILEHAYTPAEIDFATLKGKDNAIAQVLAAAAPAAGCEVHLALLTITEHGWAEYGSSSRRGRRGWQEPELVVGEVIDGEMDLTAWRRPDGAVSPLKTLPVLPGEFAPPDIVEQLQPDEQEFHEASGNEGATFDRTYRRAVLVLWPADRLIQVEASIGLSGALPRLEAMLEAGALDECRRFAAVLIAGWEPEHVYWDDDDRGETTLQGLLPLLTRLGDATLIEDVVARAILPGHFGKQEIPALLDALEHLSPGRAPAVIEAIIHAHAAQRLERHARLLALAAARLDAATLRGAAAQLAGLIWEQPELLETGRHWKRGSHAPGLVIDLVRGLSAIDADQAARCVTDILADPKRVPMDAVVLPAVRDLAKDRPPTPAAQRLIDAAVAHLRARIALPLDPPADWRRDNAVTCKCPNCRDFARFLLDPGERQWKLRAAAPDRDHVANSARKAASDVDTETITAGRPYTLLCTKNQASHERRVKQRKRDLGDLKRLGQAP